MTIARALTLTVLLGAGCVKAPPAQPPQLDLELPRAWSATSLSESIHGSEWWTDFGSAELSGVVDKVLEQNYDLRAAAARLDQAMANATIAGADLWPQVGVGFDANRSKQNFIGFPIPGQEERVLSTTTTRLGISLDVSWEVDLWGRLSARARAGLADFQASSAELQSARLSLAAQAVKAWFSVAEARQQLALAQATVESWRSSSEQVRDRFEEGIRPSLDLRLAIANLAGAEALLEQRKQQLDAAVRQLEVLLGEYPDKSILTPRALPDAPPPIPAGVPAEVLARRPDLVAAERRVAAAGSLGQAARRDLYPRLSLTAAGGTATRALEDLLDGDFSLWSLAGNVVQPIFQGGRLRAAVARADSAAAEVLAAYAGTALRAFAEVEIALAAENVLVRREEALTRASVESRRAQLLAEERYGSGLESFVTVLEAQRRSLEAEGALIAARRLRLENRVDLHLALGGGFEPLAPYYQRTNSSPPGTEELSP